MIATPRARPERAPQSSLAARTVSRILRSKYRTSTIIGSSGGRGSVNSAAN